MSVLDLLTRIESASVALVLSKESTEGTLEIQEKQKGSTGSLNSPNNNQVICDFVAEDIKLTTVCKCGYRRPFCACGFHKFPG